MLFLSAGLTACTDDDDDDEGTYGLEVQSDQLTSGVPEDLRHVVRGVDSSAFGIKSAQLQFIIPA